MGSRLENSTSIWFKQIYGENGGPGGLFHSLRITPAILDICEDINKFVQMLLYLIIQILCKEYVMQLQQNIQI